MTSEGVSQRVLVGVDGSAESVAALAWASRYAAATGATLRAVQAWHFHTAVGTAPEGVAPEPVRAEVEQRVHESLAEAVAKAQAASGGTAIESEVLYGHPAEVLIDESRRADLLVVGHRGHGAFSGMLIGSVSIHCVNHAACPVVVVRTAEPESA